MAKGKEDRSLLKKKSENYDNLKMLTSVIQKYNQFEKYAKYYYIYTIQQFVYPLPNTYHWLQVTC